jgi:LacI family transcriptional regulator
MERLKVTTLKDVAKAAGLSPTAVSRYLNQDISLPPDSAGRIEEAIRELNYLPNRLARNLSLGSSRLIGLVIPEISKIFRSSVSTICRLRPCCRRL